MLALLLKNWKLELVLIGLAACFFVGRASVKTDVDQTKTVDTTNEVDKKQVDDQKVTQIKKAADGSTVTTITEHIKTNQDIATTKRDVTTETKTTSADAYQPNWGVGGGAVASWGAIADKPTYYVKAARRVLGNAWVEAEVVPANHQVSAGVRIDF